MSEKALTKADSVIERALFPISGGENSYLDKSGSQIVAAVFTTLGVIIGSTVTRKKLASKLGAEEVDSVPPTLKVFF